MNKELENKIYEIITHNDTSECQTKLVALFKQTLTSHTEELKKKIEGKRKESEKFVPFQKIHYQSALDDIISELNHE
ncbi:MAG TPA: hypothetical protein PKV66_00155 [Candidatus Pelethenecus sp.]|nr:hypothetical protein [Candidatus Pelethenecus sp.]